MPKRIWAENLYADGKIRNKFDKALPGPVCAGAR